MTAKMKIRLLESVAGDGFHYLKGQVVEIPGDVAADFIRGKLAEAVGQPESRQAENQMNPAFKRAEKR